MKISTIVPAFNAEPWLEQAVNSLLATGDADLEVLIVDDGSTDATLGVARGLQARHPDQVRLLRHAAGANRGVSASRNLGIASSRGDTVCFLDADDVVLAHRCERAAHILVSRPEVDGVYEATRIAVESGQADAGLGGGTDGDTFGLASALEGLDLLRHLLRGYPWSTDAFICRRSMFARTGVFDERLRIAEDCHLWFRAAALCRIVPGELLRPVAVYRRHGGNSFHYGLERKVDMVRAMASALQDIRTQVQPDVEQVFTSSLADYLLNTIVVSREAARPALGWAATWQCLKHGQTRLLSEPRLLRQLAWLGRETMMRRRGLPAEMR